MPNSGCLDVRELEDLNMREGVSLERREVKKKREEKGNENVCSMSAMTPLRTDLVSEKH